MERWGGHSLPDAWLLAEYVCYHEDGGEVRVTTAEGRPLSMVCGRDSPN
ncbi:hypothetical protein GCM10010277_68890 [Streptomyces longisporoflavus]|nr:hypothetical protein [Streptomyces longisporoflavus]GGV63057.1 hypothetical protein GCM10010277_68890 [Streptomyces longisporoflavus]